MSQVGEHVDRAHPRPLSLRGGWEGRLLQLCSVPPPSPFTAASSKQQFTVTTTRPPLSPPSALPSDTALLASFSLSRGSVYLWRLGDTLLLASAIIFSSGFLPRWLLFQPPWPAFSFVCPFGCLQSRATCSYSAWSSPEGPSVPLAAAGTSLLSSRLSWSPDPAHPA